VPSDVDADDVGVARGEMGVEAEKVGSGGEGEANGDVREKVEKAEQ